MFHAQRGGNLRPLGRRGRQTQHIDEAGRYARDDAERIVAKATVGGRLSTRREDPRNGRVYRELSEVIVAAPETLEVRS